jgi:hypothetical protein
MRTLARLAAGIDMSADITLTAQQPEILPPMRCGCVVGYPSSRA